jgi:hypothetical protein
LPDGRGPCAVSLSGKFVFRQEKPAAAFCQEKPAPTFWPQFSRRVKNVSYQLIGANDGASVIVNAIRGGESMCGIVGLFLKDPKLEPKLGAMLTDMLITMTDRGPDSAGIAIYSGARDGLGKLTVQSAHPETDFKDLDGDLHAPSASRWRCW